MLYGDIFLDFESEALLASFKNKKLLQLDKKHFFSIGVLRDKMRNQLIQLLIVELIGT